MMPAAPETEPFHDLPPVAPAEVIQALDGSRLDFGSELPASNLSRRASAMSSAARAHSRQSSGAAPGTPVPALITGASQVPGTPPLSSRMEESVEAARELEAMGRKRAAELEAETLREGSGFEAHVATTVLKSILKTKNDLVSQYAKAHKNDSPVEPQSPHYVDTLEADIRDGLMHPLKPYSSKSTVTSKTQSWLKYRIMGAGQVSGLCRPGALGWHMKRAACFGLLVDTKSMQRKPPDVRSSGGTFPFTNVMPTAKLRRQVGKCRPTMEHSRF